MGENTAIEWTDHTFSPWVGCTKVGPPCDNCYAEALAKRTGHPELWQGERRRTTAENWTQPIKWNATAARLGVRHRVFCASLADVFDNQVPSRWRDDLWFLIEDTPNLDWLLLTKRPQNIKKMLPNPATGIRPWGDGWPNVWLGMTSGNQPEFDRDWPHLSGVAATVRFISYEPALGPLEVLGVAGTACPDWVICGGESGPHARPMSIRWVRELRDQCVSASVPFFFKQFGEWAPAGLHRADDPGRFAFGDYEHDRATMIQVDGYPRQFTKFGARSTMQRVGKKAAGRLLDGIEWNQIPNMEKVEQ